jgi:tetratricopeptide (TPR) repeat protein
MTRLCTRRAAIGVLVSATIGSNALAQEAGEASLPASFGEPMPLYTTALGPFSRTITTASPEAQSYFDQGFQLMYAFGTEDAARSFREAQRRDPECAMCFWGEAWAWGPYLNGSMDADDAPRAYAAIQQARRLAREHASETERAFIDAMAVRYVNVHDQATRARLDTAYANAMEKAYEAFPEDLDVGALYAEALFLLEPRRGTRDINKPAVQRIHQVLESVLARDIRHPGACHLYVHATESTIRPDKAEACAEYLGNAIPGASHINHMPSHTWNLLGRWGDAVRANIQAWHSDQRAAIGQAFAIYPSHNLHMLLFSASMDGQGAIAIQAGKDYAKLVRDGVFYHVLALVRFGRFDEVLALETPPESPIFRGLWDFGRGYAHLRIGDADSARAYVERVEHAVRATPESITFRGHTAASLLGVVGGILRAELLRHDGRADEGILALERAAIIEDGLRYDEPEPLNFSARDWLGAALLEAGRASDAERVYREALADHPHNGWALLGLEQALRGQGDSAGADAVHREFEEAWARSDTWIRASRF